MSIKRITVPIFVIMSIAVLLLTFTNNLPNDMLGSFALMFVLGLMFGELGDRIPFVAKWLGGGPILCIFGPALLIYFNVLPKETVTIMKDFMNETNFFAFFIVIMISGAMFSISRKIIIKASLKFIPTILGGLALSFILAMIGGVVTGFGWREALYYLAIPIMGGGVGAGALPLSQIYAQYGSVDATQVLSTIMPAVVIGNVLAMLFGVILNNIGKSHPNWTGNGNILKIEDKELIEELEKEKNEREDKPMTIQSLGVGFFVSMGFYMLALIINIYLVPSIHTFVWLILLLTITKTFQLVPEEIELATIQWSQVWVKNLLYAALVPIGIAYMDIGEVIASISNPAYLIITILIVMGAALGAGLVGGLMGLYPVESAIAGGLCMANMAQTGDLATLAAANRMELLPYSAYSSRIGGSIVLVLAGILISITGF